MHGVLAMVHICMSSNRSRRMGVAMVRRLGICSSSSCSLSICLGTRKRRMSKQSSKQCKSMGRFCKQCSRMSVGSSSSLGLEIKLNFKLKI